MKLLTARAGLVALLTLVATLSVIAARVVIEAQNELSAGDLFLAQGKYQRAIDHYRRTLRWSFPVSPYVEQAAARLEGIAKEREAAGDRSGALLAWRSLLGGLSAARFMYGDEGGTADRAKGQIARLMAVESRPTDGNSGAEDLAAFHRTLLDRRIAPDALWGTFLLFGFAVWVASLFLLIERGFDVSGHPQWPSARGPLAGALAGFTSFVLGLLFA
jgi:tetratricopeptide (TPR) repeat protein